MSELLWIAQADQTASASFPWLEFLTFLVSLATFGVAFLALNMWRNQLRANKQMQFWDSFIDAVDEYVMKATKTVTEMQSAIYDLRSYAKSDLPSNKPDCNIVAFIDKWVDTPNGCRYYRRIRNSLPSIVEYRNKIASLLSKGSVLNICNYDELKNACQQLFDCHDTVCEYVDIMELGIGCGHAIDSLVDLMYCDRAVVRTTMLGKLDSGKESVLAFMRAQYRSLFFVTPWSFMRQ